MNIVVDACLRKTPEMDINGHMDVRLGSLANHYVIKVVSDHKNSLVELTRGNLKFVFGDESTFATPEECLVARIYGEYIFGLIQKVDKLDKGKIEGSRTFPVESLSEECLIFEILGLPIHKEWERAPRKES